MISKTSVVVNWQPHLLHYIKQGWVGCKIRISPDSERPKKMLSSPKTWTAFDLVLSDEHVPCHMLIDILLCGRDTYLVNGNKAFFYSSFRKEGKHLPKLNKCGFASAKWYVIGLLPVTIKTHSYCFNTAPGNVFNVLRKTRNPWTWRERNSLCLCQIAALLLCAWRTWCSLRHATSDLRSPWETELMQYSLRLNTEGALK